jgi:hypothetical protein
MPAGSVTMPQAAAEGVKCAHTDTLHQLAQEVLDIVDDPSIGEPSVVQWVNRCLGRTILELARRRVYLPSLAASGEVETMAATEVVALPADWHDNLHGAWDVTTGRAIMVRPWPVLQRLRGPGPVRHGQIMAVASFARQLRYWTVPHSPLRIAIQYHRQPTPLAAGTDKLLELPVEIATDMVLDFCCAEGFSRIEQEQNDGKSNTAYHRNRYVEAVDALALQLGPWPEPAAEINDIMGWGGL